jgi:hypothetical protein
LRFFFLKRAYWIIDNTNKEPTYQNEEKEKRIERISQNKKNKLKQLIDQYKDRERDIVDEEGNKWVLLKAAKTEIKIYYLICNATSQVDNETSLTREIKAHGYNKGYMDLHYKQKITK